LLLWENIAHKEPRLGNPSVFNSDRDKSKWTSFSITFRGPVFVDQLKKLTGKEVGTEGAITIKDSNWLISFAMTPHPFFKNQPENVSVCWGYGLSTETEGNYIEKKMSQCTGREILVELCSHLGMQPHIDHITETATCIPCLLPYITSQFLPRTPEDRPRVEYSVRAAQMGVYSLLHLDRKVTSIYKGYRNPHHVFRTVRTAMRPKITGESGRMAARQFSRAAVVLMGWMGSFYSMVHNIFRNVVS
jgi:oleate hydratase